LFVDLPSEVKLSFTTNTSRKFVIDNYFLNLFAISGIGGLLGENK